MNIILSCKKVSNKMRITIKTKPNSKKEMIEKIGERNFLIAVKEHPFDGKANNAIVKSIAKYFNVSSAKVRIISGHKSKQKIIEIS